MKYFCPFCEKEIVTKDFSCYSDKHFYMLVIKKNKPYRELVDFLHFGSNSRIIIDYDIYPRGISNIRIYGNGKTMEIQGKQYGENKVVFHPDYLSNFLML